MNLDYYYCVLLLILLFVGLSTVSRAQDQNSLHIEGEIIDSSSKTPLSFANVGIVGTMRGTTTNENGQFVLAVDSLPVQIVVSYIGYGTRKQQVTNHTEDSLIFHLEKKAVGMDEVVIKGRTGAFFVRKARQRVNELSKTPTSVTQGVHGFYRQKTGFHHENSEASSASDLKSDTVYTEYLEMFTNTFVSPFGVRGWAVEHGRYGIDDGPEYTVYFKNFSLMTSQWLRLPPYRGRRETKAFQPFHSNAEDYFSFTVEGRVRQEERDLVKVAYDPKENVSKPAFAGHIFIDTETYAVHRYEGKIHTSEAVFFDFQGQETDVAFHFSASFRSLGDPSIRFIDRVRFNMSYDHIVADYRRRYTTTSTFFVYDYDPDGTFGASGIEHDYAAIDSVEYDPEFWRNNPVLARTPVDEAVIRSFEETGGFGSFVESRAGSE